MDVTEGNGPEGKAMPALPQRRCQCIEVQPSRDKRRPLKTRFWKNAMVRTSILAGTLAMLLAGAVAGAPGDLDVRWANGGVLRPSGAGTMYGMALQPDGSLIVAFATASENQIVRFDAAGYVDAAFGSEGRIVAPVPPPNVAEIGRIFAGMGVVYTPKSVTVRPDGHLDALWCWWRTVLINNEASSLLWSRYLPSGQPDLGFGQNGVWELYSRLCGTGPLEQDSAGRSYRIEQGTRCYYNYPCSSWNSIDTYGPDGTLLERLSPFPGWWYVSMKVDSQSRLVIGLKRADCDDCGFKVGRVGDGTFGIDGVASFPLPGHSSLQGVAALADGGVAAYGTVEDGGRSDAVVVRFTAGGQADPDFGASGATIVPLLTTKSQSGTMHALELPDGRLLLAASVSRGIAIARIRRDGSLDPSFGNRGIASFSGLDAAKALAVRPTGEFLVAGNGACTIAGGAIVDASCAATIAQFRSGDPPPGQRLVVEYLHSGFGHYFITANEAEIAHLDTTGNHGWARTGRLFYAYDPGPPPLVPVCRFWSDRSFVPKSSHFYTPYEDECAKVRQNPIWLFEGNAFFARMPEGTLGARTCPVGTRPLFRAYNEMKGGAPNHRYMTDPAVLDAMIAQSWIMEGEAATRVFACVPAP